MTATAVQQAINLLRQRLTDARSEKAALDEEAAQIEAALHKLGVAGEGRAGSTTTPVQAPNDFAGMSIAGAVRAVIESEMGPWTPSLVRERLAGTAVQGGRSSADFTTAIRTAFHNLRKRGLVMTDPDNKTVAQKWHTDAETPAVTGASDLIPANQEGVVANGAVPDRAHDESSSRQADHRVHDLRAPVGG